jgi:myosin heavy subunit
MPERENKLMKKNTVCVRDEMTITSYGNHTNGNCKKILAVELQKVFNSLTDAADFFGVDVQRIWNILNGYSNHRIGYWERDENGNKIRRICMVRLTYLAHFESSVDALMECGRESTEKLNKANETIGKLQNENEELRNELHQANAVIYGLRNENEELRKENERIAELERKAALWDAYEKHQEAKRKAIEDIENYKRLEQEAIALRQESERKLAELMRGDEYVA